MDIGNEASDVILIGAGLSCGLLAWMLKKKRPELRVKVFEASDSIPTTRTWSFHGSDLGSELGVIRTLISREWDGYDVRFRSFDRTFNGAYASIRPRDLQSALGEALGGDLHFGAKVATVGEHEITLADGRRFGARAVLDGRGLAPVAGAKIAYQKFVGAHLTLEHPHGLTRPVLMDATVQQESGYRFVYVLPWGEREALVEDTRYSSESDIDRDEYLDEISAYALGRGWQVERIESVEQGALPLPLDHLQPEETGAPAIGMSGGLFHPVTGYSLPDAVRVAARVCALPTIDTASVARELRAYRAERAGDWKFFLILNRLMFEVAEPLERFRIFEHFYSLPEGLIERFYKGTPKWQDKLRIFAGKPPVPVTSVVKSLRSVLA